MAAPIPCKFADILKAVAAWLTAWPAVNLSDSSRIGVAIDPMLNPHVTGDREILLVPGWERKDPTGLGSGRVEARVRRSLTLRLRTRMNLDVVNRDNDWLMGAATEIAESSTLGHLAFEDAVIDAMYLFQPVDNLQNALTFAPIEYDNTAQPRRGQDSGYGYSDLRFDVPYIRILNQNYQ